MQFVLPRSVNIKSKYYPRHFAIVAEAFAALKWHDSVDTVEPGEWAIVVRSPGSRGVSRPTAKQMGIPCAFDLLSAEELDAVRTKGGRILVDFGWEILNPTLEIVTGLSATLAELEIDPSRVVLFHSNQAARQRFNNLWRQTTSAPPPLGLEYPVGLALHVIHQQKKLDAERNEARRLQARHQNEQARRSRLFVSFNGEVRPHRLYIGAALESMGLLERGYFSLVYPKKRVDESFDALRAQSVKWFAKLPRGREFMDAAARLIGRLPIQLDLAALPTGNIEELAWESQDPMYYDDSRFTIVVDTTMFEEECLFVTEKVLKPIMNHSPFMLIGSPGGIDLLRSYGFKTFEPYLRQSDSSDANAILTSAIDEVERISKFDEPELAEFSNGVAAICDYNAAHFWTGFPQLLEQQFHQCMLAIGPKLSAN